MKYELFCQNSISGSVYDITELAGSITHTTYIDGQPGKLMFSLSEDPQGLIEISNGSIISFRVDDYGVFYGYVFTLGTSADGGYRVTAYDQMRYLKNKGMYITRDMTASEIFELICRDNFSASRWEVVVPSYFVVPEQDHTGKTLYETIYYAIEQTIINEGKRCFIKDKYGTLQFSEIGHEKTNVIIGELSLLSDYDYEYSIDKDTYNTIVFYQDDEETGNRRSWLAVDESTQKMWGTLQMLKKMPDSLNEAQLRVFAENYLKAYNHETKSLRISALGIKELIAGSGFSLQLDRLGIREDMWITTATHTYDLRHHTMRLEVFI